MTTQRSTTPEEWTTIRFEERSLELARLRFVRRIPKWSPSGPPTPKTRQTALRATDPKTVAQRSTHAQDSPDCASCEGPQNVAQRSICAPRHVARMLKPTSRAFLLRRLLWDDLELRPAHARLV